MAQTWKRDYTRYKNFFLNVLSIYNSKPNLRVYLELVLTLGTIIMFVIFAIKPTILTIIDINNEIKNKEAIISSLEKKITDLQTASSILQKEESNLIQETMSIIDSKFKGIEISSFNPLEKGSSKSTEDRIRRLFSAFIYGRKRGLTIIGPANIVKEMRKDPRSIQLFLSNRRG